MRKLASIQIIKNIEPIKNANSIEVAEVLGWRIVVKKGEFNIEDKAVFFEIDSLLPTGKSWSTVVESTNYRVKTRKFMGQVSQGLAVPVDQIEELFGLKLKEGQDVTELLGVKKWEPAKTQSPYKDDTKKWPKWKRNLWRYKWFRAYCRKFHNISQEFPTHLVAKTDETRLQSIPWIIDKVKDQPLICSEKLDGTSSTFIYVRNPWYKKDEFWVCSRNTRKEEKGDSCYAQIVKKYNLRQLMKNYCKHNNVKKLVLQGEIIGPKIQKNKYNYKKYEFFLFNIFKDDKYICPHIKGINLPIGIKLVPLLNYFTVLDLHNQRPKTVQEWVKYSETKSVFNPNIQREGIVVRTIDGNVSFKVINPRFLLKWDE